MPTRSWSEQDSANGESQDTQPVYAGQRRLRQGQAAHLLHRRMTHDVVAVHERAHVDLEQRLDRLLLLVAQLARQAL